MRCMHVASMTDPSLYCMYALYVYNVHVHVCVYVSLCRYLFDLISQ